MTLVKVRQRGQITLPKSLRQAASIDTDYPLTAQIIGQSLVLSPARQSALSALQKESARVAKKKGITLEAILKEVRSNRRKFNKRYYGIEKVASTA